MNDIRTPEEIAEEVFPFVNNFTHRATRDAVRWLIAAAIRAERERCGAGLKVAMAIADAPPPPPSPEVIEAAARAIHNSVEFNQIQDQIPWDELSETAKERRRHFARLAIDAYRKAGGGQSS